MIQQTTILNKMQMIFGTRDEEPITSIHNLNGCPLIVGINKAKIEWENIGKFTENYAMCIFEDESELCTEMGWKWSKKEYEKGMERVKLICEAFPIFR